MPLRLIVKMRKEKKKIFGSEMTNIIILLNRSFFCVIYIVLWFEDVNTTTDPFTVVGVYETSGKNVATCRTGLATAKYGFVVKRAKTRVPLPICKRRC